MEHSRVLTYISDPGATGHAARRTRDRHAEVVKLIVKVGRTTPNPANRPDPIGTTVIYYRHGGRSSLHTTVPLMVYTQNARVSDLL